MDLWLLLRTTFALQEDNLPLNIVIECDVRAFIVKTKVRGEVVHEVGL